MESVYVQLLITLALGFVAGIAGSLVWGFGVRRSCLRLGLRLADVEERLLSMRGSQAAKARWDQAKWLEQQALDMNAQEKRPVRYANDPPDV